MYEGRIRYGYAKYLSYICRIMYRYKQKNETKIHVRLTIPEHNSIMREVVEYNTTISEVVRAKLFQAECLNLLYKGYSIDISPMGMGTDELSVFVVQKRFSHVLDLIDFAIEETVAEKLKAENIETTEDEEGVLVTVGNHPLDGKPLGFLLYTHEEDALAWIINQEDTDDKTAWMLYAINEINTWLDGE